MYAHVFVRLLVVKFITGGGVSSSNGCICTKYTHVRAIQLARIG